ncbi:MAG: hypothetical protein INR67_18175 [Jatrophihabitans endophyticus]|nr:hypothetical protein [Jatrophihabitans endophyticus]
MIVSRLTAAVVLTALTVSPALARHHHRHRAPGPVAPSDDDYSWGDWQAEAIARATARQRAAPGLTEELAPDAKETATGGPSGGVPGFSGH